MTIKYVNDVCSRCVQRMEKTGLDNGPHHEFASGMPEEERRRQNRLALEAFRGFKPLGLDG